MKSNRIDLINQGIKIVGSILGACTKRYHLNLYMSREDLEDLKQDCIIVMIGCIDRKINPYNPNKGKLSTFLHPRINGFIKDQIEKLQKAKFVELTEALETLEQKLDALRHMSFSQVTLNVDCISKEEATELVFEIVNSDFTFEIMDALLSVPESRRAVLFSYYCLNKSVIEIAEDKGFTLSAGWIYRLKREGLQKLKDILREKGII